MELSHFLNVKGVAVFDLYFNIDSCKKILLFKVNLMFLVEVISLFC